MQKNLVDNAKPSSSADEKVKRNVFDISKKHFASYGLAKFYPIYSRFTQANEKYEITPYFKLDLDTMAHEIRNRLTAHVEFTQIPLHAIWKDFQSWFQTNDIVHPSTEYVMPYLDNPSILPGSLLNHFGIPASVHSLDGVHVQHFVYDPRLDKKDFTGVSVRDFLDTAIFTRQNQFMFNPLKASDMDSAEMTAMQSIPLRITSAQFRQLTGGAQGKPFDSSSIFPVLRHKGLRAYLADARKIRNENISLATQAILWTTNVPIMHDITKRGDNGYNFSVTRTKSGFTATAIRLFVFGGQNLTNATFMRELSVRYVGNSSRPSTNIVLSNGATIAFQPTEFRHRISDADVEWLNDNRKNQSLYLVGFYDTAEPRGVDTEKGLKLYPPLTVFDCDYSGEKTTAKFTPGVCQWGLTYDLEQGIPESPFGFSAMKLNALRARAYRCWYNATKRDAILDPFCPAVNPHDSSDSTTPYIDRCVENWDSGLDQDTPLDFERCLWDEDIYNGCLPSPSMMNAKPLVGVYKQSGADNIYDLTYQATGSGASHISLSVDGDLVTGISGHDGDPNILTLDTLQDAIKVGISLEDLRSASALQNWYETQYKHGRFSCAQFIYAHFGSRPKGMADNFPRFVGRYDLPVTEWEVFNQTETEDSPLGKRAAMGTFGGKCPKFVIHSDEPSIILGILWFSIDNNMTDCLNKSYYTLDRFEMPDPQFADIGVEPIRMRELCPLRCNNENATDIFGYNRPYAWMIEEHDTIAGEFCNSRNGEIMVRRMKDKPTLSPEFKIMNENEITNIFTNGVDQDHIYGQIWFDASVLTWLPQRPNMQIV